MNVRRLQGLSLIASAVCLLVGYFGPDSSVFHVIAIIGTLLLIFGIPAIQSLQPSGSIGLVGILLIELGALIALAFQLGFLSADALSLVGAIASTLGMLVVGWLTTRKKVFPAWVGWAFIVEGLLNLIGGLINFGSAAGAISLVVVLISVVALLGYGYPIFQKK